MAKGYSITVAMVICTHIHTDQMAALDNLGTVTDFTCSAEDLVDAKLTSRTETLTIIQRLTMDLIQAVANDQDPELLLVRYISSPYIY